MSRLRLMVGNTEWVMGLIMSKLFSVVMARDVFTPKFRVILVLRIGIYIYYCYPSGPIILLTANFVFAIGEFKSNLDSNI